jgi:hypothetical protein
MNMKLRIKGNSIRLRLGRSEVEKLESEGYLEEQTRFAGNTFLYALQASEGITDLEAEYNNNKITVFVPAYKIKNWSTNDVIGFNAISEGIFLLVEKDFVCLDETFEDQSDNFENPKTVC